VGVIIAMDQLEPEEGDYFEGVLLETYRDYQVTRPRVRPVELLPKSLKVEFPRDLREGNPIGTRFRANVFVRQKHYTNGLPKGPLYLRAENSTIKKIKEPTTDEIEFARQKRGSISGRSYEYVRVKSEPEAYQRNFYALRERAYKAAVDDVRAVRSESIRRERLKLISDYALLRSKGDCEACQRPAPFIRHNDQPYLEIHHIISLADGGADSPVNVAAVCPNCHTRVSHGKDGLKYNLEIKTRVGDIEGSLPEI
jgi:5-methylcytosine-specific restriction endonuclease McrA